MKPHRISPQSFWAVRLECPYSQCEAFETALADIAVAVSSYEVEEHARPEAIWGVEGLFTSEPARGDVSARIALAAQAQNLPEPQFRIEHVPARDWLKDSYESFAPLRAGRFYIYGDHITDPPPPSVHPVRLNAATAFGSGEHESTYGCLLALSGLRKSSGLNRAIAAGGGMLDLGCGSGILALGMAKAWRRTVLATDIDPEAVRVASLNVIRNQQHALVRTALGDGLNARAIRRRGPFALVTANILARPLCRMSRALTALLRPGGVLVMAGLLQWQEAMVLGAYRRQGLKLMRRIVLNGWSTLVLKR
ncbi:MAG: 50S ribosomal protein L11 methyltransferase [Rhodospirillaceae bacterium]|nr:50S ribosomal protein L11 methyltransferase [Rhodospirillaceae bacterium]